MKKYEVWSEGFEVTGNQGKASFDGFSEGETFDEAVIKLLGNTLDKDPEEFDGYRRMGGKLSIWGCRIFDNEIEARECFG